MTNKFSSWRQYQESLPKTWTAWVDGYRLGQYMMLRPDPFPDFPNPVKQGTPMPNDWPLEHVAPDDGSEHQYFDFEANRCNAERMRLDGGRQRWQRHEKLKNEVLRADHPERRS